MTTITTAPGTTSQLTPEFDAQRGPILVASDGSPTCEPALLAARLLSARIGAPVQLVSVIPPQPYIVPTPEGLILPVEPVGERVTRRREQIEGELTRLLGAGHEWPLDVRIGIPAVEISDAVEGTGAQLVVTGLVHHGRFDRMLQGETPIAILNRANVPTLAVPPGVQRLPRCALIAVDLTEACVDAALYARTLLPDVESVYLVHVQTRADVAPPMAMAAWDRAYQEAMRRAFARVKAALDLAPGVHVETKVLSGSGTANEILDFAEYAKVDLVVSGHRHRSLVERMLSSSVAAHLFRGASTWILMVPEGAGAQEVPGGPDSTDAADEWIDDRSAWPTFLESFTNRNAGRRVNLEIQNQQVGAQTTVVGYPFLGIDFDRHGSRVDIMLGDVEGTARHLTHTIRRVQRIQVYRTPEGRDAALRLTDRFGHTLLTIAR